MFRITRRKVFVLIIFNVCLWLCRFLFMGDSVLGIVRNEDKRKIILTWTTFFGNPMGERYLNGCPFKNLCTIITSRSMYSTADALVFHPIDMNLNVLPPRRTKSQIYVFLSHESPSNTNERIYSIRNFFNWTMTYRMDSDIPYPYRYMIKTKNIPTKANIDFKLTLQKKPRKLIVWFASNCYTHSKREQYVDTLRKHIPVDTYGACGNNSCPRSNQAICDRILQEYKFYLAFENSLCLDYVTEKFYARTHLNSVPIVLKRSLVEKLFPKSSFVAADDFSHPKFLAAYLKYLDSNDTAYWEYLRWKYEGYESLEHDEEAKYFGFCGLCQRLLNGSYESKSYHDIKQWWVDKSYCDNELVSRLIALKNI